MKAQHLISALIIAAALASIAAPATYYISIERLEYPLYGFTVKYAAPPIGSPNAVTLFLPRLGQNDRVSVTAYVLLPNGSTMETASAKSVGRVIQLGAGDIRRAYTLWSEHLRELGIEPDGVSIGLTVLGTVLREDGLYGFVSVVPINVGRVEQGYGIEIDLNRPLHKLMSKEDMKKIVDRLTPNKKEATGNAPAQVSPPSPIKGSCDSECYFDPSGTPRCRIYCYEWRYVGGYSKVMHNVNVPLVATVILGNSAYNKISYIHLAEVLVADESDKVKIGISAVAGITSDSGSSGISYEVVGRNWEASSVTAANLTYQDGFARGKNFWPNSIVYLGFKGDISFATYRLYVCIQGALTCVPSDVWANITTAMPLGGGPLNNSIAVKGMASLYYYNNPVTRIYLDFLTKGWINTSDSRTATKSVSLMSFNIKWKLHTLLSLAGGFNVLSLMMSETTQFSALLSTSVGITAGYESREFMYLSAYAYIDGGTVRWTYAKSPVLYKVGDKYYKMGCVFVRITG